MNNNIWLNGIMGLVVGDAFGSPAQFLDREEFADDPITEMEYCECFNTPPGSWTDDSSMTIATLDSLIKEKGYNLDEIAKNFVRWLELGDFTPFGRAYDVGNSCYKGITNYERSKDAKTSGGNEEYDNGNGSLMRIMPMCLYAYELQKRICTSDNEVIQMIHEVSGITHRHLRAQMACGLYFYMVKSILDNKAFDKGLSMQQCLQQGIDAGLKYYGQDIRNLTEIAYYGRLFDLEELKNMSPELIRSSGYVIETIETVCYNLTNNDTYEGTLISTVNMGGDADTTGAIAGGLAGLYYGYESIPDRWITKLQRREYIEELCVQADKVL